MRWCLIAAFLSGLLAAACAPAAGSPPGPPSAPASAPTGGAAPTSAFAPTASPAPQRVTIGIPSPTLSFLPAQLALKLGYFRQEGLDVEFVRIAGNSVIPALMSGELDFTTLLSSVGAHAAQGGPSRMVQFHSVRLQHVLNVRPEITSIQQLAGKRVAIQSLSTLTAFETRKVAEHFGLADVTMVNVGADMERLAAMEAGAADATMMPVPANLVAERRGYPSLLRVGTVLDTPQAGLGTTETHLRERVDMVTRALRASAWALPVIHGQRDEVIRIIAEWIELSPEDATRAYEQVSDTFSTNGVPTEAHLRAYVELLQATAGAPADTMTSQIGDFTIARRVAQELGLPGQ